MLALAVPEIVPLLRLTVPLFSTLWMAFWKPSDVTSKYELNDLQVIRDQRVLILEDDVASGTTLRPVAQALLAHQRSAIDLYLGRRKDCQTLENIDSAIRIVYLAEDFLDPSGREEDEAGFVKFFEHT